MMDQQLDAIAAFAGMATAGPWAAGMAWSCEHAPGECPDRCTTAPKRVAVAQRDRNGDGLFTTICDCSTDDGYWVARNDAEYIAAVSPDVALALIAEIRRLRAALDDTTHTPARHARGSE